MIDKKVSPPPLLRGDTIGVMAPSSAIDVQIIHIAQDRLKAMGFQTYIHPQSYNTLHSSAGTAEDKAAAFHELINDNQIKAIICAAGGNRSPSFLRLIDTDLVQKNPKIICGYSDVTALLNMISTSCDIVTYHGPTLSSFSKESYAEQYAQQWMSLLSGNTEAVSPQTDTTDKPHIKDNSAISIPLDGGIPIQKGHTTGHLIGGNLSMITSLMGTPYQPEFKDSILFLEDCADELSRYDRMLTQLYNAGVFEQINGLIIGQFTDTQDTGRVPFGFTLDEIIQNVIKGTDYPLIINAPFGHGKELYTYPIGANVQLDVADDTHSLVIQ